MPVISRPDTKEIVRNSLQLVASFSGEFEGFVFRHFRSYHKRVFLGSIKSLLNTTRLDEHRYLDIRLRQTDMASWTTIGDCIDWVRSNTVIAVSPTRTILARPDLEG
ncbi:MAG: hypothetical protein ABIK65_01070 [Candidatus Eisenbacteria bacterium]